jgi:hypothetical protein
MKKYVIVSSNENPKYLFYLPLVRVGWCNIGWDMMAFYAGDPKNKLFQFVMQTFDYLHAIMPPKLQKYYRLIISGADTVLGFKSDTIAQVSRLYAGCFSEDNVYLMTSDADMLPLSNYWDVKEQPIFTNRNGSSKHMMMPKPAAWGRDLTDYHYPICYVGAMAKDWKEIMNIDGQNHNEMIMRDLRHQKNEWVMDQDILTERILAYGKEKIRHINRGTDQRTGYPIGRVDRSNWRTDHAIRIDAHLPHDILTNQESFDKVYGLLKLNWPLNDHTWFIEYYKQFKRIMNHEEEKV